MAEKVNHGAISPHFLPAREEWLSRGEEEEILEPDLPIVDPHHHLWDFQDNRYLLGELLDDIDSGHKIVATIFVECRAMYRASAPLETRSLGETEFANGIAAMSASGNYGTARVCAGIVGNVDLRLGGAAGAALEAHITTAGDRFRGIRNVSAWHSGEEIKATTANPPPGLLSDAEFRQGFACLAPLGLSFDAWLLHTQLNELGDLARAFPDTKIILDHVGGPIGVGPYSVRRDEVFVDWRNGIYELAKSPNVRVKLGGLGMRVIGFDFHEQSRPPSSHQLSEAWRPYIETCIDAFGTERCMFESNFPVDKGMCSYQALWNAFKRVASGYSEDEKMKLFSRTACETYGLTLGV